MATRHGTLSANFSNNGVVGTGITLKSTEYPTKISACSSNATFKGSGTKAVMHLYFSNSGGTNIADILSFTSNNRYQYTFMGPNAPDLHKKALGSISGIQSLKGTTLYLKVSTTTGSGTYTGASGATITIETNLSVGAHAVGTVTLAQDGAGKLKVSWSGVTAGTNNGIKGYTVYLSTSSGGSAASGLSTTVTSTATSGSYTFTTNNTTTYYAAVKALSDVDYTYDSAVKWSSGQAAFLYTKCGAPTSVTLAQDGNGKLKVSWSGATAGTSNSISSYYVYLATSSGSGTAAFSATVTTTATSGSHTFTVNNTTTYYAAVRTQGSAGSSYYSAYKWSSGQAAYYYTNPGAPTSVTLAQDGNGKLKVSWSGATAGTNNAIGGYYLYLSTSSGGSAASGLTATVNSSTSSHSFTVNNTTTYYAAVRTNGAQSGYNSGYKWSSGQAAYYYTACGAPTSVSLSRVKGTVTITWSGATAGTNNAISNYGVIRNTSASATNATSVSTGGSSGLTNAPGAGTFYYGVRTQGAAGSSYYSGYKWSGAITVPSKPSVTAGTVITDTQMDTLRTWINKSGITDIADGSSVKASEGNTYRNTLTAGASKIEASWYNTAAN